MKEMVYRGREIKAGQLVFEILYHDFYKGYEFYILNLGSHPTAYVGVDKDHSLYGKRYEDLDILVHGGLSYSNYLSNVTKNKDKWYLGWDYAHYGDYCDFGLSGCLDEKKWTTQEIYEEVKNVVEQFIKIENKG